MLIGNLNDFFNLLDAVRIVFIFRIYHEKQCLKFFFRHIFKIKTFCAILRLYSGCKEDMYIQLFQLTDNLIILLIFFRCWINIVIIVIYDQQCVCPVKSCISQQTVFIFIKPVDIFISICKPVFIFKTNKIKVCDCLFQAVGIENGLNKVIFISTLLCVFPCCFAFSASAKCMQV